MREVLASTAEPETQGRGGTQEGGAVFPLHALMEQTLAIYRKILAR
jgi:hypothetical protein